MHDKVISSQLMALGIGHRFQGYSAVCDAVQLALENEDRLMHFKHEILTVLAERFQSKTANIERNIRTIIQHAWQTNQGYLCRLAGYPLTKAPSVIEFIEILTTSISRGRKSR